MDTTEQTISPSDINTENFFMSTFGKFEDEEVARIIVMLCQESKNGWIPFSLQDIEGYIKNNPQNIFWKLICPKASLNRLAENGWITEKEGIFYVTDDFIEKCHKRAIIHLSTLSTHLIDQNAAEVRKKTDKKRKYYIVPKTE